MPLTMLTTSISTINHSFPNSKFQVPLSNYPLLVRHLVVNRDASISHYDGNDKGCRGALHPVV
nr:MAG TPA: hypothetical protein [Caudoviricetes sp.]